MNKLTIVLSLLTLAWLSVVLFELDDEQNSPAKEEVSIELAIPKSVVQELMQVEQEWFALQEEADKAVAERQAKKNSKKNNNTNKNLFTIGDESYQFLGIFVKTNEPFILVRPQSSDTKKTNELVKVIKGQEISPNITLSELTSNKVTFQSNEGAVEFKLFERKIDETS